MQKKNFYPTFSFSQVSQTSNQQGLYEQTLLDKVNSFQKQQYLYSALLYFYYSHVLYMIKLCKLTSDWIFSNPDPRGKDTGVEVMSSLCSLQCNNETSDLPSGLVSQQSFCFWLQRHEFSPANKRVKKRWSNVIFHCIIISF